MNTDETTRASSACASTPVPTVARRSPEPGTTACGTPAAVSGRAPAGRVHLRLAAVAAVAVLLAVAPAGRAEPSVGPVVIQPGIQLSTPTGRCTANFVFQSTAGPFDPSQQLYIGTAGHCGSLDDIVDTTLAAGASGTRLGTIVHDDDGAADFALVAIDMALNNLVSPSVRHLCGPVGVYTGPGNVVVGISGHGSAIGTGGTPRYGLLGPTSAGGAHAAIVTSGGDSGGPFVTTDGLAVGQLHCSCAVGQIGLGASADIRSIQAAITSSGKVFVTCPTATPWARPGCPPL